MILPILLWTEDRPNGMTHSAMPHLLYARSSIAPPNGRLEGSSWEPIVIFTMVVEVPSLTLRKKLQGIHHGFDRATAIPRTSLGYLPDTAQ